MEVLLDLGGDSGERSLRIGGDVAPADAEAVERWTTFDLSHGLPRLPPSQAEQWTPQQLSLERLRAFSVKKGCYPGQEIVARTHFLGQAKRGLALFEAAAPVAVGSQVDAGGVAAGTVVSAAGGLALAVVARSHDETADAALQAGDVSLRAIPLAGGLAR